MADTAPDTNARWWPEADPSKKVMARARDIARRIAWRRDQDQIHLRLYSETEWRGVYGIDRKRSSAGSRSTNGNKLSINVVRNMCNAATSMLIRSRPYVSFQTDGADWDLLKISRHRERFVQAHFIREKVHLVSQARARNATIFGFGGTKVLREEGKIGLENILPGEILVDEQEGIAADPPCIYQAKLVDKDQLAALYPEFEKQIRTAMPEVGSDGGFGSNASQILVVYAWHFRTTRKKKHDGVECLCIDGATLYKREYKWKKFPGTFLRWEETPFGFYGTGIPSELIGLQYEINALLRMVRDSMYYGGNVKLLVQKGSLISESHLSNTTRIPIVQYTGNRPEWVVNDAASGQVFQHLQYLVTTAYEVTGISKLDAQSQTPSADMSGRSRLIHQNNESLRFKGVVERYEDGYPELAERILEAATDELEENGDQEIVFKGRAHLDQIKLSDVTLRDDDERVDIEKWSSSQLAQSPGARMTQVDFLVQNNYLPKRRALRMMDFGADTRSETDLANAPYDLIDERMDRILYDGEQQMPEPYMDLDYALDRVQLEIQRCELRNGVPQERITMLRDFREAIIDLKKLATPPPAPPMLPPGAGPMNPGAPLGPTDGVVTPPGALPMPPQQMIPPGAPMPGGAPIGAAA